MSTYALLDRALTTCEAMMMSNKGTVWACVQEFCDGEHHYYVKAEDLGDSD